MSKRLSPAATYAHRYGYRYLVEMFSFLTYVILTFYYLFCKFYWTRFLKTPTLFHSLCMKHFRIRINFPPHCLWTTEFSLFLSLSFFVRSHIIKLLLNWIQLLSRLLQMPSTDAAVVLIIPRSRRVHELYVIRAVIRSVADAERLSMLRIPLLADVRFSALQDPVWGVRTDIGNLLS